MDEVLNGLRKYTLYNKAAELERLMCNDDTEVLRIANAGLVKAGKSSFFNTLVDSFDMEVFATGAARKTTENQEYKLPGNIILIDTPGVDAKESDTEEAFKSFMISDVIIYLHNVKHGELNKAEIEFITKLKKHFVNENEFWKRFLFILTWIDQKERDDDYQKIIDKINSQLKDLSNGKNREVIKVSAKRYLKGAKENKRALLENSNILQAKQEILKLCSQMKDEKVKFRISRVNNIKKEINNELEQIKDSIECDVNDKKWNIKNESNELKLQIKNMMGRFQRKWEIIQDLKRRIS